MEALEARLVLDSTMTIDPANQLVWVGSAVANNMSVSFSAGTYTFHDPSEAISVTNNGTGTVTGAGTNTVTVTQVASLGVDGGDGSDSIDLLSLNDPTTVLSSGSAVDAVNIGNAGSVQDINSTVTILNNQDLDDLTIDDSADPAAKPNVQVGQLSVSGLAPGTISYGAFSLHSLTVKGGTGGNTFTIPGLPNISSFAIVTTLDSGTGNDTVNVQALSGNGGARVDINGQGGSDAVNIGNAGSTGAIGGAVNVTNTAGLTALSIDDSARTTPVAASLQVDNVGNTGSVTGLSPGSINFLPGDIGSLTVRGGSGGNVFNVNNTIQGNTSKLGSNANVVTALNTGSGSDTVNVSATAAHGTLAIDTQGGTNVVTFTNLENVNGDATVTGAASSTSLVINDSADSGGDSATLGIVNGLATLSGLSAGSIGYATSAVVSTAITAGSGDDSLTVDFAAGNPIPVGSGLLFDGGPGSNTLNLKNGAFSSESYVATGPGTGHISLGASSIAFTNLRPINDTVAVTNYSFTPPAGPQLIQVNVGPTVLGFQTMQIASGDTPPSFELANIANKTNVTISAGPDGNDVVVNDGTQATSLASLTINSGNGADAINVLATPPAVTTSINAGGGNDSVSVRAAGLGAGGTTTVNGGAGFDTLNVDASGLGPVVVTPTSITVGGAVITDSNFESINVSNAADLPLTGAAATINATEGAPINNAVVASFTDADPNGKAGDFVASINWGDGSPLTAGTVVANGTTNFQVLGSHTYTEQGSFTVTVTITDKGSSGTTIVNGVPVTVSDNGGQTTTAVSTATVVQSALLPVAATLVALEGAAVPANAIVATFTDPGGADPVGDYSATIDWGDGTTTPGVVVANGVNFSVMPGGLGHTYADEGIHPLVVTITDSDTGSGSPTTAFATGSVAVLDAPLAATGTTVTGTEGTALTDVTVATFTDANPGAVVGNFTATINWGDGIVTAGTVAAAAGGFSVSGSHVYEEGTFPILVTIQDDGGSTATATSTATIADAALTAGTAVPITATEGTVFIGPVATFTDANPLGTVSDFTATITWGDGKTSAGVIHEDASKTFSVIGFHVYAEEGSFPVSVAINDVGGSTASATTTATVADAALIAAGIPVAAVEGASFSGPVAIFADRDPAGTLSDFSATINWGDGTTSAGTVANNGTSGFVVNGTHTYAEEGAFPVSVTINDSGGGSIGAFNTATVADAPPTSTNPVNFTVTEGDKFSGPVAAFSEIQGSVPISEPASDFRAFIDWGDGTPVTFGTIVTQAGGLQVTGIHTYADSEVNVNAGVPSKNFPVTVTILDDGGTFVRVVSTATVFDRAINLTGQLNPASDSGQSHFDAITNVSQPNFYGFSEPFSVVRLFAAPTGAPGLFQIASTTADASGFWSATSAHLADGCYTITASAIDRFGHTTGGPITVLPNGSQGPLVIDTVGPRVANVFFNRLNGEVDVVFQDERSGMNRNTLLDSANYQLTKPHTAPATFLVTNLNATPTVSPTSPVDVAVVFNSGKVLRGGFYTFTIRDSTRGPSTVQDVAGNSLDGEFYGNFPSGNGIRGGDFVAMLDAFHNKVFAPQTVVGTANPANGGQGGPPVGAVHSGIFVPVVPRGGGSVFPAQPPTVPASLVASAIHPHGPRRRGR